MTCLGLSWFHRGKTTWESIWRSSVIHIRWRSLVVHFMDWFWGRKERPLQILLFCWEILSWYMWFFPPWKVECRRYLIFLSIIFGHFQFIYVWLCFFYLRTTYWHVAMLRVNFLCWLVHVNCQGMLSYILFILSMLFWLVSATCLISLLELSMLQIIPCDRIFLLSIS